VSLSLRTLIPAFLLAAAALAAAVFAWPQPANADANTINARAGDGEPGYAVNVFLPNDITILTGDTITWDFRWLEPHTVAFGTPTGDPTVPSNPDDTVVAFDGETFFSSGLVAQTTFSVQFNKAGSYTIFCVIHPLMTGTVTVVDSGTADAQDDLDTNAEATYQDSLQALKSLAAQLSGAPVAVENKTDGTKQYTVHIGGIITDGSDIQQFFPPSLNVDEGDTVVFSNETPTPHTATFRADLYPGGDPFEVPASPLDQPYDGSTFWNSGMLGVDWPGGLTWSVTFSTAGTYDYVCLLHAEQGMVGSINVAAAEAEPEPTVIAPQPPATGTGTAGSTPDHTLLLAVLAAVLLFTGATTVIIGQRSH
jgi:plastocyanin